MLLGTCLMGCGKSTETTTTTDTKVEVIEEVQTNEIAEEPVKEEAAEEAILKPGVLQASYQEEIEGNMMHFFNYITLLDDHTGYFEVQDRVPITWNGNSISTEYDTYPITLENDDYILHREMGTETYHYIDVDLNEYLENWEDPEYRYSLEAGEYPSSFVEEAAGKTSFDSFDELISYLEKGQAYAYVELQGGNEGKLLLITEQTYDNLDGNMATIDVCIYGEDANGKIHYMTCASSQGTANPIAIKDGVLYCGGHHNVDGYVTTPDGNGIMLRITASESFEEDGTANYWGLFRENNTFEEETPIDSEEGFNRAMNEMLEAEVVNFTVIE